LPKPSIHKREQVWDTLTPTPASIGPHDILSFYGKVHNNYSYLFNIAALFWSVQDFESKRRYSSQRSDFRIFELPLNGSIHLAERAM
jgi:hypothetical protein